MRNNDPAPSADAAPADRRRGSQARSGLIGSGFRTVSVFTLLSRVLGLARDMAMAALFGAGPFMDAFTVAFRVPNLARRVLGEGALTAAFLPIFVREHERGGVEAASRLITAVTLLLGGALLAIVVLAEIALAVTGLALPMGEEGRLLVLLTAQMLPYTVLICVAAQFSAVLQSLHRFAWPAVAPALLNVFWLMAIAVVALLLDDPRQQIQWIAATVVLAGVCQMGLVWSVMQSAGVHLTRGWQQAAPLVREVLSAMLPVVLATSITQLNALVDSLLAWGLAAPAAGGTTASGFAWPLEAGTASALYFAQRMYQFPLGVFGVALGTVLFPLLARHTERGELDQVGHDLTLGMRLTLAIGLPASVGLILLREPIAVTLFERGAFTSEDSALTARCIAAYSMGVWAYVGLLVIQRGFFAQGDRRTPTRIGLAAVGVNVVLNLTLIWPFAGAGLALATAIAAIVQFVATAAAYQRRTKLLDLSSISRTALLTVVATAAMGIACAIVQTWLPAEGSLFDRVMALLGPFAASVVAYLLTAKLIGLQEPFLLLRRG